jgi:hypothetical protein
LLGAQIPQLRSRVAERVLAIRPSYHDFNSTGLFVTLWN